MGNYRDEEQALPCAEGGDSTGFSEKHPSAAREMPRAVRLSLGGSRHPGGLRCADAGDGQGGGMRRSQQ